MEIICGDAVDMLQKRRRAANAVTRRSHPRTFARAGGSERSRARGRSQADVRVQCLVPRRRGMSRPDAGAFYHPAATVACEDSAFACGATAGWKHEAKRRGRFQPALAGETSCWNRSLGGRERAIFSSCACRRRRREPLAPRLFWEPRGVSAAAGMVTHVDLLSHQRVCRGRRRPRTRVRDRQNPPQSDRECEREP
jgi:hypothetical protein